jgi:Domain of unknown function (DUF4386)
MARTAGVFYLLEGAASAFGAIHVVSQVTVSGNATATAASVLDHQALMWAGFGLALVAMACHIVYAVLFYELFKPVSRTLSLLAAAISLVAAAIQGCAALIVRSAFIPAVVGVLAMCAGVCYLTLLAPPLAGYLYPWYLAPDVIGEPVLMLWLLIVGLNPGAGYGRQVLQAPDKPRQPLLITAAEWVLRRDHECRTR